MAVREAPPPGLLDSFSAPLWERLGLSVQRTEWIVKGQHRGYDWMAIETHHETTNFLDNHGSSTTFFVMRLPRKSRDWYLPPSRITSSRQVCVDEECVYVAELGQQPRVREWRYWLDTTADVADEVVRTKGTRTAQPRAHLSVSKKAASETERSWNPHDTNWVFLWCSVMLPLTGLLLVLLTFTYTDWLSTGNVTDCDSVGYTFSAMQGWRMWALLAILVTPLVWMCKMVHTMFTRIYKPGFVLQINLEGAVLVGGTYVLAHALDALEASVGTVC